MTNRNSIRGYIKSDDCINRNDIGAKRSMMRHLSVAILVTVVALAAVVVAVPSASATLTSKCPPHLDYSCVGGGYNATTMNENWAKDHYGPAVVAIGNPPHNCTLYAAWMLAHNGLEPQPNWGYAYNWGYALAAHTDSNPAVGSIAWYDAYRSGVSQYGHVAYVAQVDSVNRMVLLESDNAPVNGNPGYTSSGWVSFSSPSGYIHLKDVATTRPAQPVNPRVTSTTGSSATLTWTDASNNEAAFVSQYRSGNGAWIAGPSVGANATSMTIDGLTSGTSYTFQIAAQNSVGRTWSVFVSGRTVSLPAEPTNPRVTSTTGSSAGLTWTDASNNETAFVSHYRIGTGAWIAGPTVGANVRSTTINGLASGTAYTFQVGSQNSAGTHWSAFFYGSTPGVLPAEPVNPSVTSTSASTASLAWTDASNNETAFVSQYRSGNGAWIAGPTVGANATSLMVGGLAAGTTYTFQVGAQNSVGRHWSVYFTGTTGSVPVAPAEPVNPSVTSTSASTASLAWTDASNNETAFVSQYRSGNGAWIAGPTVGANATSLMVGGLAAGTTYTFQVGAQNSVGTHWSVYFTGTTGVVPPPSAYHAGRQVTIDSHATGGVSGHTGPASSYAAGPTRGTNSPLWIVCYVTGTAVTGPYNTTTIWDLSDDGYYYTDAWLYTGTNNAAVAPCALRNVTIDSHATGGVSGHRGPDNSYATGPTHATNSAITIVCYVDGQAITGPYNTTTIWDLANDGYYYTDAWLYTGTNSAAVPHC